MIRSTAISFSVSYIHILTSNGVTYNTGNVAYQDDVSTCMNLTMWDEIYPYRYFIFQIEWWKTAPPARIFGRCCCAITAARTATHIRGLRWRVSKWRNFDWSLNITRTDLHVICLSCVYVVTFDDDHFVVVTVIAWFASHFEKQD